MFQSECIKGCVRKCAPGLVRVSFRHSFTEVRVGFRHSFTEVRVRIRIGLGLGTHYTED